MSPGEERKSSVIVRIAGEEHAIRASAEPEYTRSCARFVDERIAEIRSRSGLIEGYKAAILAALSITDEYFQARERLDRVRSETSSRAQELVRQIDEALDDTDGGEGSAPPSDSRDEGT
ncbi:MAG: cell division protein ZapA [Gemmatimonadota bacterium]|jgi:cell division protein ZapA (FtsZ GTPase activity inhibitor)